MDDLGNLSSISDVSGQSGAWTSNVSPTIAVKRSSDRPFMLITDGSDQLQMLEHVAGSSWNDANDYNIPLDSKYKTIDQPGFAWAAYDRVNDPQGPGHWWITFPTTRQSGNYLRRMKALRIAETSADESHRFGQFHNTWTIARPGSGLIYLDVPDNDNLVAAMITPQVVEEAEDPEEDDEVFDQLRFFPYADGIWDADLLGANDFDLIDAKACLKLRRTDDAGSKRPCNHPTGYTEDLPEVEYYDEEGEGCDL